MNRKDFKIDRKKANAQDLRKKEKENRKLQLELNQEREKFNQMVVKHQKELNDMQAVSVCVCVCTWVHKGLFSFVIVTMYTCYLFMLFRLACLYEIYILVYTV